MNCGGYPLGADYDPYAPWNERMVKCEAFDGNGKHWYAYNIEADSETECTESVWNALPETEEIAGARGEHLSRGRVDTCEICDGNGEIEYEEDYEPDYDD